MKKYRLIIPVLICSAMAAAITTHAMCVLPSCLIQHFLMRDLLANAVGLSAMLCVALLARRIHLVVLWAIFASAIMAWLILTTFHWPLAAYFPPIAAAWLSSGCAVAAVEDRRRSAAWIIVGIWCLAISLYATRYIILERERPSVACSISAGQTN